jgi:pentatricopeptide repeat protein
MNASEPWYAVRCLIRFSEDQEPGGTYEERVTLWRADSFDAAIARAEAEVVEFTDVVGGEYVGLAQCFHLAAEGNVGEGWEVFSLMRDSDLDPDDYIARFFATGAEREQRPR